MSSVDPILASRRTASLDDHMQLPLAHIETAPSTCGTTATRLRIGSDSSLQQLFGTSHHAIATQKLDFDRVLMSDNLAELLRELDWQISQCERRETGPADAAVEGVFSLQSEGEDYARALRELQTSLRDCKADNSQWHAVLLPARSLLWKILAFSRPSSRVLDPLYTRRRLDAFLNVVAISGPSLKDGSTTQSLWDNNHTKDWITADKPSQVLLEIPFVSPERVRRFELELIEHLEKHHPVIHMLGGLPPSQASVLFPDLTPEVILEHLTVQALYHLSMEQPLRFLVDVLQLFKNANTYHEWLGLLRDACAMIPKISIIVDLSILHPRFDENIKRLSVGLSGIFKDLWEGPSPRFCQVMLSVPSRLLVDRRDMGPLISTRNVLAPQKRRFPSQPSTRLEPRPFKIPKPLQGSDSASQMRELQTQQSQAAISSPPHPMSPPQMLSNQTHNDPVPETTPASGDSTEPLFSRHQIKIAIVCALPLEADAVCALFDEQFDDIDDAEMRAPGDSNAYTFGLIGRHLTVLIHMPGMGKINGAIVAAKSQSSFPNIKLALVVGICGGVPFYNNGKSEIILGDIIISKGLIAYDYGRRFPNEFVSKSSPDDVFARPPVEIRSLLGKLKSKPGLRTLQKRTCQYLETLKVHSDCQAEYPGAGEDQLFDGTYVHKHQMPGACDVCSGSTSATGSVCEEARSSSCDDVSCDKAMLVPRKRLEAILQGIAVPMPMIHFGVIACGDQVMKSGVHRDEVAEDKDVIAFEMEGAGVWDIFPCVVLKAVCDYADSHKHKRWQSYAAATAAACAKAFLKEWYM